MIDEWDDLLNTGAVIKRTIHPNIEGNYPDYKQIVYIHYQLRKIIKDERNPNNLKYASLSSDVIEQACFYNTRDDKELKGQPLCVVIGDQVLDIVIPGIMLALRSIRNGETAQIRINNRFAYPEKGFGDGSKLGPNDYVEALIEMIDIGPYQKEPVI